jgi:hypothetical protein
MVENVCHSDVQASGTSQGRNLYCNDGISSQVEEGVVGFDITGR